MFLPPEIHLDNPREYSVAILHKGKHEISLHVVPAIPCLQKIPPPGRADNFRLQKKPIPAVPPIFRSRGKRVPTGAGYPSSAATCRRTAGKFFGAKNCAAVRRRFFRERKIDGNNIPRFFAPAKMIRPRVPLFFCAAAKSRKTFDADFSPARCNADCADEFPPDGKSWRRKFHRMEKKVFPPR